MPRREKSFKVSLSSLPASSEQQVLEEKGTVLLRHLPTLFKGWVASAYILSCAPLLVRWQGNWIRRESIDD